MPTGAGAPSPDGPWDSSLVHHGDGHTWGVGAHNLPATQGGGWEDPEGLELQEISQVEIREQRNTKQSWVTVV